MSLLLFTKTHQQLGATKHGCTVLSSVFVGAESAISAKDTCLIFVLQLASVHKLEWGGPGSAGT